MKCKSNKSHKKKLKHQSTTQKIYLQVGMENQFHIGFINCMDLEFSINAKFVETIHTGVEEPLRCISKNGDTIMV